MSADPAAIRESLRSWITADDEIRALQAQIKTIRERKTQHGAAVLEFMKGNNLDNFVLDGAGGGGTIARSERTVRPALKRSTLRQQLLLQFADQPERVAEALRAIEGIPEGDDMSAGGTKREVLSRRLPRAQNITLG
uniref:Uncharacterized protein n=1 Tax=viral metagenome TaxID=1070528 RepID=A0A6C0JIP5_9ZZZZ